MTKILVNPKLFAAAGVLFAVASFYNFNSTSTVYAGTSLAPAPAGQQSGVSAKLFPAPQCCNLRASR